MIMTPPNYLNNVNILCKNIIMKIFIVDMVIYNDRA